MNPAEVSIGNDTGNYSIAAGFSYKETTGFSFLESEDASYLDFKIGFDISDDFNIKLNAHIADFGFVFDGVKTEVSTASSVPALNFIYSKRIPQDILSEDFSCG
jgi:hypothetical protein